MKQETLAIYTGRIERCLLYIQAHLDEPLTLETLARIAHFSPYHFHRVFKGMVGEGVKEHIRRLRLERAALQLKSTDFSVTRIAFEAGYETHESFTRSFRSAFGKPPRQFRNNDDTVRIASPSLIHYMDGQGDIIFKPDVAGGKTMQVHIERQPILRVAFVRHTGPYETCSSAWDQLCSWAAPQGLFGDGCTLIGLCHDDPEITPPEAIRYDACLTITGDVELEPGVGIKEIEDGVYAVTTHYGAYENLGQTYVNLIGKWLPQSGYSLRDAPSYEVFLSDPESTPSEELLTDIYVPLEM